MKEVGLVHWNAPNSGALNESEFTALPGGYRDLSGLFKEETEFGIWWSRTEGVSADAYHRILLYDNNDITGYHQYKSYRYF